MDGHIWARDLLRITKPTRMLLILSGITFLIISTSTNFEQNNLILFATVKFHISYEKRLKIGEQRKIPGVNITKICANLSAH